MECKIFDEDSITSFKIQSTLIKKFEYRALKSTLANVIEFHFVLLFLFYFLDALDAWFAAIFLAAGTNLHGRQGRGRQVVCYHHRRLVVTYVGVEICVI